MSCVTFEADRVLKSSGEAASPEFEAHLVACASCQADVAEFREIARLYRDASTERLPEAVAARLREQGDVRFHLQRGMRMIGALAAAVMVAAMMWMLLRPQAPLPPKEGPAEASTVAWEPTTPSGEFLIVLNLDERLRAAQARAAEIADAPSAMDGKISELKRRVASFRIDRF
jgi:anti-sigma factor RsiW